MIIMMKKSVTRKKISTFIRLVEDITIVSVMICFVKLEERDDCGDF